MRLLAGLARERLAPQGAELEQIEGPASRQARLAVQEGTAIPARRSPSSAIAPRTNASTGERTTSNVPEAILSRSRFGHG